MTSDMSLKARIRNIAKEKNISAQAVLQNYLLGRFLFRLSISKYNDKFVVKGGILISSIVGIDQRTTMDLDTTLRDLALNEDEIRKAFIDISGIDTEDGISFNLDDISPIRDDDEYGGYRLTFHALFGKINAPMSMDISTGDIMTPGVTLHEFKDQILDNDSFQLWSYPIETILAEKAETILSRGVDNTRPRDFYDILMLSAQDYDKETFRAAFNATASHRSSLDKISEYKEIVSEVRNNPEMQLRWTNYTKRMRYANGISFDETIEALLSLLQ